MTNKWNVILSLVGAFIGINLASGGSAFNCWPCLLGNLAAAILVGAAWLFLFGPALKYPRVLAGAVLALIGVIPIMALMIYDGRTKGGPTTISKTELPPFVQTALCERIKTGEKLTWENGTPIKPSEVCTETKSRYVTDPELLRKLNDPNYHD